MSDYNEDVKTTLMGGFDKEDVLAKFKALSDESYAKRSKMALEIENKNKIIDEKDAIIAEKDEEIETLKKDIAEKYQGYIDNYDTIGKIVYEPRVEAEKIKKAANSEAERIIAEAEKNALETEENAKSAIEKKIADGKRRYEALQDEINELIQLVNQVQHTFMQSFKKIHEISGAVKSGSSDSDLDDGFIEDGEE